MHGTRRIVLSLILAVLPCLCGCRSARVTLPASEPPPDAASPHELTAAVAEALSRTEPRLTLHLPETASQWDIAACITQARTGSAASAEGLRAVRWQLRGGVLTVQPEYRAPADMLRREKAELALCAVQFAVSSAGFSPQERVLLMHDRILRECRYLHGAPAGDSAAGALLLHKAECGGYAAAFALLAEASGLPCRIVTGAAGGVPHAWNLVFLGGAWYHVDCAWDDTEPSDSHRYFLRSDAEMRRTHTWDAGAYPAASGGAYSYAAIAAGMQLRG